MRTNRGKRNWKTARIGVIICFICALFCVGMAPAASTNTASSSAEGLESYSKQEILFLKWGKGDNEIGLLTVPATDDYEIESYRGPRHMGIDGKNNIYIMDTINERILVFDVSGKSIRKINYGNYSTFTLEMLVEDDGDIFIDKGMRDTGKTKESILRFTKDEKKFEYDGFSWGKIVGNKIYDFNGSLKHNLKDKKETRENTRPHGKNFLKDFYTYAHEGETRKEIIKIKSAPIKKWLNDSSIPADIEITLPIESEESTYGFSFIDVDLNGNLYFLFGKTKFENHVESLVSVEMQKYSLNGKLLTSIPLKIDWLIKSTEWPGFVKVSQEGDFYYLWTEKRGVHVEKWNQQIR